jgi:type VI protein secretion system component VasF
MTLLETTEPIFQYVCRLNRVGRKSGTPASGDTSFVTKSGAASATGAAAVASHAPALDYAVVRSEIKGLFEDMQSKSAKDFRLASQVQKIELPMMFFVDSLISESQLSFAAQWNQNRLAYEKNELAGDEKFFDLLDETLKDSGEDASERLAVFYSCLGLGFSGIYFKQPELLRKNMLTIAPRIKRSIDVDESARMCPDAYEALDSRDLTEPPSRSVFVISIIFVCLAVAALVSYLWLYHSSFKDLNSAFSAITDQNPASQK